MMNVKMNIFGKKIVDEFELIPTDSRKSFYKKAIVYIADDGTQFLRSYDTIVASKKGGKVYRHWNDWSATTGRHIASFCGMGKKQFEHESIADIR